MNFRQFITIVSISHGRFSSRASAGMLTRLGVLIVAIIGGSELALASDPLMDRDGRTLEVRIDNTPTVRSAAHDIADSDGLKAYTTYWTASTDKSPKCFQIEPKDARLGKLEKADILIFEIRSDRPNSRWKSYQVVPSAAASSQQFLDGKGFCPSEFILTERLRYPTLPPGEYLFRVAYWGVGNWDRQDILLTIK